MRELPGLLIGLMAALPILSLLMLWRRRPPTRSHALLHASVAVALAVLILMIAGTVFNPSPESLGLFLPVAISSLTVGLAANRTVNRPPVERNGT